VVEAEDTGSGPGSDCNEVLRKRETIKDDDLSSSCGEHRTKEE